jgi:hypothetical protein
MSDDQTQIVLHLKFHHAPQTALKTRTLFVAHKTITKPSTFVNFVIKFEGGANPTHNLSFCGLHNHNWQG